MAYPTRDRDPLLGGDLQSLIERRGKEVIGGLVAFAGLLVWLMLVTHSPEDPNWLNATDAPVRNWLGPLGASLSHPMFMVVGKAAWIVPLAMLVWGLRFVLHRGEERAMARATFIPVAIVISALFLATLAPDGQGSFNYRAGGMLGYTVLSMVLTLIPIGNSFATGMLSMLLFGASAVLIFYALGITLREARRTTAAVFGGSLAGAMAGASLLKGAADRGAALSRSASEGLNARRSQHRSAPLAQDLPPYGYADDQDFVFEDERDYDDYDRHPQVTLGGQGSMFSRNDPRFDAREMPRFAPQPQPQMQPEPQMHAPVSEARRTAVIRPQQTQAAPRMASPVPPPPEARHLPLDEDDMPRHFGDSPAPYPPSFADVAPHIHRYDEADDAPRETGFLSRASGMLRRAAGMESARAEMPEPELVPRAPRSGAVDMPDGDRIRSKISQAIAARKDDEGVINPLVAPQPAPRPRRMVMAEPGQRIEPPLTASHAMFAVETAVQAAPVMETVMAAAPAIMANAVIADGIALPPKAARPAHFHSPKSAAAVVDSGQHVLPPMPHRPRSAAPAPEQLARAVPPTPARPRMPSAVPSALPDAPAAVLPKTTVPMAAPLYSQAPAPMLDLTANTNAALHDIADEPPLNIFDPDMADLGEDLLLDAGQSWEATGDTRARPEARVTRAVGLGGLERAGQSATRAKVEKSRFADYELPPIALLSDPTDITRHDLSDDQLEENARLLESVLDDYGIKGEIVSVRPGPVVTMYELEPAPGLKASRVIGLADDIARSMSALSARVSTVPGRSVIGIELPNAHREKVVLREILEAREYGNEQMRLPLALGKDIGGEAIVANLAKMPHLLIAGTTGSGKSVAINTMILSLLYKLSPDECRLIMIDPKMLELSVYDGIPHLLSPVVTDPKKAVVALKWVVAEMEERYRKMSRMGVRNIEGYNGRVRDALARGEMFSRTIQTGFDEETGDPIFETEETQPQLLPFIVVIVDEMADLMMVAGKEIEACIQRLAQMARASGIHLIMATQRPSVDVITGTIKANFPTRISFQVTSKIDSRTILGEQGAEQLLGMGDMLYMAGGGRVTRVHGPFVSDEEVEEIVNYLKTYGPPDYQSGVVEGPDDEIEGDIDAVLGLNSGGNSSGEDALYDQAVAIVARDRKCSTSYIQRKLGIGYNKAARLVEQMEEEGVVTAANHVGKREILLPEP
ncbi:DNA translocase FtsK [Ketogulonicigenium vulgare]|uniref:DNA translocase FtsK n=1 Tax=Ketogulonicigenium vulgare TaxID=92945 RepID=UPI0023597F9E|nr:DNA translocase FtsK 4TM domain-containing protein [Ketogulonicigenium vulgare]